MDMLSVGDDEYVAIKPSSGIPRNRLKNIPKYLRRSHHYCYFLHDLCVRLLVEYEKNKAHLVSVNFRDDEEKAVFEKRAQSNTVEALRFIGRLSEARSVLLNATVLAMVPTGHRCSTLTPEEA